MGSCQGPPQRIDRTDPILIFLFMSNRSWVIAERRPQTKAVSESQILQSVVVVVLDDSFSFGVRHKMERLPHDFFHSFGHVTSCRNKKFLFPFFLPFHSTLLVISVANLCDYECPFSYSKKREKKLKLKAVFMQIDSKDSDYKKIVWNTVWKWLARRRITITISSDESTTDGRRMEEAIGFASQSIQRMKAFQFGLEMRFFTYFSGFSAVCRSQQKS